MAIIKENGTIVQLGEVRQGTSAKGFNWSRQQVVIDIPALGGNYSRKLAVEAANDLCESLQGKFNVGDKVEFTYKVSSREWNSKWYSDVELYSIEKVEEVAKPNAPQQEKVMPAGYEDSWDANVETDLPF